MVTMTDTVSFVIAEPEKESAVKIPNSCGQSVNLLV
jgi:hypothetical protein